MPTSLARSKPRKSCAQMEGFQRNYSPVAPDRFKQRDEAGFRALALERVCRGGKPEAGRPMEGCLEIRKRDEVGTGPQEGRKEWRESRGEV